MLDHLLHDERIPSDHAHTPGRALAPFFAQGPSQIKTVPMAASGLAITSSYILVEIRLNRSTLICSVTIGRPQNQPPILIFSAIRK